MTWVKLALFQCFLCPQIVLALFEKRSTRAQSALEQQAQLLRENTDSVQIVYPTDLGNRRSLHDSSSSRRYRRHTEIHEDDVYYKVQAFGETHRLKLRVNNELFAPSFKVERFHGNKVIDHSTLIDHCYLTGETIGTEYTVALNDCDGLAGVIVLGSESLVIEPLLNTSTHRDSPGEDRPHVVYKTRTLSLLDDTQTPAQPFPTKIKVRRNFPTTKPTEETTTPTTQPATTTDYPQLSYDSYVEFVNTLWRTVKLIYVDPWGREVFFQNVLPRSKQRVNTFLTDKWLVRDDETKQLLLINNKHVFVPTAESSPDNRTLAEISAPAWMKLDKPRVRTNGELGKRYIEVLAIADESMVKWHGKDNVERYVLTMINIASVVYKHKSLPVRLQFVAVRLIILEKDPYNIRIVQTPSRSLTSVCRWSSLVRRGMTDSDPDYHDLAVFVTKKEFGPAGYAPVWGMCRESRSCTLNRDDGFTSSFIIAHEVGHTLGLGHDGIDNDCREEAFRGSVMAPTVYSRYDQFFWSTCSHQEILASMKHFHCLNDAPTQKTLPFMSTLPGVHYTLDEQCQFDFDKNFTFCTAFYRDPCKELWCNMPGRYSQFCRTMRGPALDGSRCAEGKWCFQGFCIPVNTTEIPLPTTDPPPVDGGWSEWSQFGECSRTCGTSIKSRQRQCNNPSPANGGRPCQGEDAEYQVCKTKECPAMKEDRFTTVRRKVCESQKPADSNGDVQWTIYNPNKVNLDCDFQRGFCKWRNAQINDEFDWELIYGPSPSDQTGPLADHTMANETGRYIYTEASRPQETFHRARLESPPMAVRISCLSFWYVMNGLDLGDLNVYINSSTGERKIWSVSGHQGEPWLRADITVNATGSGNEGFKIVIESVRGYGFRSDIGLDDISFRNGACESDAAASVEHQEDSSCLISCRTVSAKDERVIMDLQVTDGLPCHKESEGEVCIGGTCRRLGCDNVIGSTKVVDSCGICGGDNTTCSIRRGTVNVIPKRDFEPLKSFPKGSTGVKIEEGTPSAHHLALIQTDVDGATLGINVNNEILPPGIYTVRGTRFRYSLKNDREVIESLDQLKHHFKISVRPDKTKTEPVVINYVFYRPKPKKKTPKFKWVLKSWTPCNKKCGGGKQTAQYQCKAVKNNHVVENRLCAKRVPSKERPCNKNPCKKMFEWVIGPWSPCSSTCAGGKKHRNVTCVRTSSQWPVSLRLCGEEAPSVIKICGRAVCKPEWRVGNWTKCSGKCGRGSTSRTVECKNWLGIESSECDKDEKPQSTKDCQLKPCPTDPPKPVLQEDITKFRTMCSFEYGFCQWKNSAEGDFDWKIRQGNTPSNGTGPSFDHSTKTKNGKYIYIEASKPQRAGLTARLESPLITTKQNCLQFWFHMYGKKLGILKILLRLNEGMHTLWSRSINSGNKWLNAKLTITTSLKYRIIFEGTVGEGWSGDIALDDISITPGRCTSSVKSRRYSK